MKKFILAAALAVSNISAQATTTLVINAGQEELNSTTKANLYSVSLSKRNNNGVEFFGSATRVVPVAKKFSSELRPEVGVGYATVMAGSTVYGQAFMGQRILDSRPDANYHGVKVGVRTPIANGWFTDVSYRYRDSNDLAWENHTYVAGLGRAVTKSASIVAGFGKTTGDYSSQGVQVLLITRY